MEFRSRFGRQLVLLVALILCCLPTRGNAAESRSGHLVIIGGGKRPAAITDRFIDLAGGRVAARLVIISLASEDAAGAASSSTEEFKKLGVADVQALSGTDAEAARIIGDATGIYFTGGDQQRLVTALAGTPVVAALHQLRRRGGVIGGTSAGAAVMSARMITGEEKGSPPIEDRFCSIQSEQIMTTNGFAFLPEAVIDQHFIARKRANRLFSVVMEHPNLLGIGIDESTAIVVGADEVFEVLGDRSVMVIDARHAERVRSDAERHLAGTDLRVHLLLAGDRFSIVSGRPVLSKTRPVSQ